MITEKTFYSSTAVRRKAAELQEMLLVAPMKTYLVLLAVIGCVGAGSSLQAQTLNWGNVVGGPITTSAGDPVNEMFVLELGAFDNNFIPSESNTDQWFENWRVFDRADYDPVFGFSTATVDVENGVTSSDPGASTMSFAGLDAFIWVRNDDHPVEGSEWLLTRSSGWNFPLTGGDCCDTSVIEWSVTDLQSSGNPEWGRNYTVIGPGVFTSAGTSGLQTFTFVPEPTSVAMSVLGLSFIILRRRRES